MFKHLLNQIRISLTIQPDGPILVKSSEDATGHAKMNFVRTRRNGEDQVFLPGSSLKGALRAHAERLARTLCETSVCNPFNTHYRKNGETKNASPWGVPACHDTYEKLKRDNKSNAPITPADFSAFCPACQLFGSLSVAGRFNISDAYLSAEDQGLSPEYRDGVAIDRFTGGAFNGALFSLEAQTAGRFETQITLENVTWWQVAWVGLVLRDLQEGLLPIGAGSSRGLGRVKATLDGMQVDLLANTNPQRGNQLPSLSDLYPDAQAYGLADAASCALPPGVTLKTLGLRHRWEFDSPQAEAFLTGLYQRFATRINDNSLLQQWRDTNQLTHGLQEKRA